MGDEIPFKNPIYNPRWILQKSERTDKFPDMINDKFVIRCHIFRRAAIEMAITCRELVQAGIWNRDICLIAELVASRATLVRIPGSNRFRTKLNEICRIKGAPVHLNTGITEEKCLEVMMNEELWRGEAAHKIQLRREEQMRRVEWQVKLWATDDVENGNGLGLDLFRLDKTPLWIENIESYIQKGCHEESIKEASCGTFACGRILCRACLLVSRESSFKGFSLRQKFDCSAECVIYGIFCSMEGCKSVFIGKTMDLVGEQVLQDLKEDSGNYILHFHFNLKENKMRGHAPRFSVLVRAPPVERQMTSLTNAFVNYFMEAGFTMLQITNGDVHRVRKTLAGVDEIGAAEDGDTLS